MSELKDDLESLTKIIKENKPEGKEEENSETETPVEEEEIIVVEEEEVKEKEKEEIPPKNKNRRNRDGTRREARIEGLIEKNRHKDDEISDLKKQLDDLNQKEQSRSNKEVDEELKVLDAKKKEAFESSDYEEFKKYESQMNTIQNNNQMNAQETIDYFKSQNPWYKVDEAKSLVAEKLHDNILKDSQYRHLSTKEQLDIVSKKVNEMPQFKKNPYQESSPTEGAPISQPSKNEVIITRSELDSVRKMFPNLSEQDLKVKTRKLVIAVNKNEENNYG